MSCFCKTWCTIRIPNKFKACAALAEMYYAGEIEGVDAQRTNTVGDKTTTVYYVDRSFEAREKEAARLMHISCLEGDLQSACEWLDEKGLRTFELVE